MDVDSGGNSEDEVKEGVWSIINDDDVDSGNRIAELLSGRKSVVGNISEVSGMSISVLMSVSVIEVVTSRKMVVGLIDTLGEGKIDVDISGISMSTVDSGVTKAVVGRNDNSELNVLSEVLKGNRMDDVISGISKSELLSSISDKVLVGCTTSELLSGREKVELGDIMSSILDRIENEREERCDDIGRLDSVRIGKDVKSEFIENITDITGIDVS